MSAPLGRYVSTSPISMFHCLVQLALTTVLVQGDFCDIYTKLM